MSFSSGAPSRSEPSTGPSVGVAAPTLDEARHGDVSAPSMSTRRIGRALVAFGVTGLVLLGACLLAVLVALVPLANTTADLERQRTAAVELIAPAADALESTANSAQNAGASLGESVTAARTAASVTGRLADALEGLAAFSSAFADTAGQSRSLSDELNRTASALSQNEADSTIAATQLRTLADRVRQLGERLGSAGSPPPTAFAGVALPLAIGLVVLVLLWLAAIAIASIWLGRRLSTGRAGGRARAATLGSDPDQPQR